MHPLGNSINDAREEFWEVPSKAIMVSTDSGASDSPELEKLDGANSFSITAMRFPCWVEFRIYWTRVVFPDPKNPVRMVTGTGGNLCSSVGMVIGILVGVVVVRSLLANEIIIAIAVGTVHFVWRKRGNSLGYVPQHIYIYILK